MSQSDRFNAGLWSVIFGVLGLCALREELVFIPILLLLSGLVLLYFYSRGEKRRPKYPPSRLSAAERAALIKDRQRDFEASKREEREKEKWYPMMDDHFNDWRH